eukprot:6180143-Pleurochrysis_carterae.AAC.3
MRASLRCRRLCAESLPSRLVSPPAARSRKHLLSLACVVSRLSELRVLGTVAAAALLAAAQRFEASPRRRRGSVSAVLDAHTAGARSFTFSSTGLQHRRNRGPEIARIRLLLP